jgi:4-hydroxyphenylpyruvate dioxygenase
MSEIFENPIGLDGFEFVEFAAPDSTLLDAVFKSLGFQPVADHRSKDVTLYRQGAINFIVNREPESLGHYFAEEHGPSACAMGFRVHDAHKAYDILLELGAQPIEVPTGPMELRLPAIIDFKFCEGGDRAPEGCGLMEIDHLTHNVYRGRMDFWAGFYERLFNFREVRYFDIKGEYTGLHSRAMSAPDGRIRIPLNEEASNGTGQIEEFLLSYNGEGIQHIALSTPNIFDTVDRLRAKGVEFMTPPPDAYYEMLEERLPGHGESVEDMRARGILIDGSTAGDDARILLQIFTQALLGPVFFEIIQRKRDEGFGEGNFQALFESIERDQLARGIIEATG